MAVEIRQTTVTPDTNGGVVQLHISDAKLEDASASFQLVLTARVPNLEAGLLAHYQRAAMKIAAAELHELLQAMAKEIRSTGLDLEPHQKGA